MLPLPFRAIALSVLFVLPVFASVDEPAEEPSAPEPPAKSAITDEDLLKAIETLDRMDQDIAADPSGAHVTASGNNNGQPQGPTVITAQDTEFSQDSREAVFQKNVFLVNSSFNMVCDKLTVYMRRSAQKGATPVAAPAPAGAPGIAGQFSALSEGGGSMLEKAVAEGHVTITQDRVDEKGKFQRSTGHGKKAVYDAATGKITLSGSPDLQQGENLCEAQEEGTLIILNKNGRMDVVGPVHTVIRESLGQEKTGQ